MKKRYECLLAISPGITLNKSSFKLFIYYIYILSSERILSSVILEIKGVNYYLLRRGTRVRERYLRHLRWYMNTSNTCLQTSKTQEISCFTAVFFITASPLNRHSISVIPLLRRVIPVSVAIVAIPGSATSLHRK